MNPIRQSPGTLIQPLPSARSLRELSAACQRAAGQNSQGEVLLDIDDAGRLELRLLPQGSCSAPNPRLDDVLAGIIAGDLAKGSAAWKRKLAGERVFWARAVVQTIPQARRTGTLQHLEQLTRYMTELATTHEGHGSAIDIIRTAFNEFEPHWRAGTEERVAAIFDLERRLPRLEATRLLEFQALREKSGSPSAQLVSAVDILIQFISTGLGPADRVIWKGMRKSVEENAMAQHALLEQCIARLESGLTMRPPAPPTDDELARMLTVITQIVDESVYHCIFTQAPVLKLLDLESTHKLLDPDLSKTYRQKLKILERNQTRYQCFADSRLGNVPSMDHVSRTFALEMYERSVGKYDPKRTSLRQLLVDYTLRQPIFQPLCKLPMPPGTREPLNPEQFYTWSLAVSERLTPIASAQDLQLLLTEVTDPDDPDEAPLWEHALDCMDVVSALEVRDVFAQTEVINALERCLRAKRRETSPAITRLLPVLRVNAQRLEAFMASDVAHNPDFDDVDRVLLVPWWEAVRGRAVIGRGRNDERPVVAHAQETASPSHPGAAQPPRADTEPEELVVHVPASTSQLPPPLPLPLQPVASQREPAGDIRPEPAARAEPVPHGRAPSEVKLPPSTDAIATARPADSAPLHAPVRAAQTLPSANPNRTDMPATGHEMRNAERRRGHHDPRRMKWLSRGEVKRRLDEIRAGVLARHEVLRKRADAKAG